MSDDEEVDVDVEHDVNEFDGGTPIWVMTDGSVRLKVPAMPPSWPCVDGAFDSFEDRLARELGVAVEGMDKELFGIAVPAADTVERLKVLLVELRTRYELG